MIYTLHESLDGMDGIIMEGDKLGASDERQTWDDIGKAMRHAENWRYKIVKAWDYLGDDNLPSLIEIIEL